jgi:hypothetical protein
VRNKDKPHIFRWLKAVIEANRLWFVSMVTGVFLGCSPDITDKNQLSGALKWQTSVVEGDNQSALPKQTLDEPIVVQILDADGKPIKDASVEAVLVEADGLEKNVGVQVLAQKWEEKLTQSLSAQKTTGTNSAKVPASSATGATGTGEEERLGRIEKLEARTDENGKARLWVRVPSKFQKTVKVIIRAGASGVFGAAYTVATLASKDFKTGASLFFKTTNENKEKAGDEFDITLTVKDSSGNTASSFEGDYKVKIEATPKESWAGIQPNFPNGEVNCRFFGGVCLVPKSPYRLVAPEELKVKVSFVSDIIPPTDDSIVVQPKGEKKYLVLKNHEGPLRSDSQRIKDVSKQAGSETSLTAAWIDDAGNFVEDATDVTWTIDNPLLNAGLPAGSKATTVTFKPLKTGDGYLSITAEGKGLLSPVKLNIPSGPFVKWGVRIGGKQENPKMTAGECASVDVFAADELGNANGDVNLAGFQIRLSIENGDLPPYVAKRAYFDGAGVGQNIRTLSVTFTKGEASGVEKVCLFDAKSIINPKVKVVTGPSAATVPKFPSLSSYEGLSERIQVDKGAPVRLGLIFNNASEKHVCWTYESDKFQDRDDPCIVEEVAENSSHTQNLEFKPVVFDSAGNVAGKPASEWQQLHANNQLTVGHSLFAIDSTSSTKNVSSDSNIRLKLDKVIDGGVLNTIQGTISGSEFPSLSGAARQATYSFFVSPRKPTQAEVIPCVNTTCDSRLSGVKATDQFGIKLRLLDSANNPVLAFVERPAGTYPRKKLYRIDKPTGELNLELENKETAFERTVGATSINEVEKTPRQGTGAEGSYTPLLDYESPLTQNTPVDTDGFFLLPPNSGLYFQSFRAVTSQKLSGALKNLTIGSQTIATIPVESVSFPVTSGAPFHFRAVDPSNGNSVYNDAYGSKIAIQQTHKSASVHLAKSVVIWGIDKYSNLISTPQPAHFEWTETSATTDACIDGNPAPEGAVYHPLLTIPEGSTTPNTRQAGTANVLTTRITPTEDDGYRVYLHSPCNRKGRLQIIPIGATYDASFSTFNFGQKSKLPEIEFVGDIEHHFFSQAIAKDQVNPRSTSIAIDSVAGVSAGTEFFLRLIPLVQNSSNHVNSYEGVKQLRLSGVNNVTWANSGSSVLPPPNGLTYYCTFKKEAMKAVYLSLSELPDRSDVPVCLIKGLQTLRPAGNCLANESAVVDLDNSPINIGGKHVCESTQGFKVAARTSGSDNRVMMVWDETPLSNIVNDPLYPLNNLRLRINPGTPTQLILSNKCGGPEKSAVLWNQNQSELLRPLKQVDELNDNAASLGGKYFQLTADDLVRIVVASADAEGNWVEDLSLPSSSAGINVSAGTANAPTPYLSESAVPASIIRSNVAANTNCNEHTLITISPTVASERNALTVLNTTGSKAKFDKITFSAVVAGVNRQADVTLAVKPGQPHTASVATQRINLNNDTLIAALSHPSDAGSANKHLSPGDCAIIKISSRDFDNNIIYNTSGNVTVDLRIKNYYTPAANKQLFQPGGLYSRVGTETRLTPLTEASLGWVAHPQANTFTSSNGGLSKFVASDPFESDTASQYVGHETIANQTFANGEIASLNRYFCVFDETATPSAAVRLVGSSGSTPFSIEGESSPFTMAPLAATVVDLRDNNNKRICPLANGGSTGLLIPRRKKVGSTYVFELDSDGTPAACKTVGVSNSPVNFYSTVTDLVGNLKTTHNTPSASSTSGSYATSTSCGGAHFCITSSGNTGLRTTGTMGLSLSATSISGGASLTATKSLLALSKTPAKIKIFRTGDSDASTSAVVSALNPFELSFQALDDFDNFINDTNFATDYKLTLAFEYLTLNGASLTSDPNAANAMTADGNVLEIGSSPATQLTPMTFALNGLKWTTSTQSGSGFFHFKNTKKGAVTVRATATFTKTGETPIVSSPTSFNVTIIAGTPAATIVTNENSDVEISTSTNNSIIARSTTEPYLFKTASFDMYRNPITSTNATENAVTVSCYDENPAGTVSCSETSTPGIIKVVTNKSGLFTLKGSRVSGGVVINTNPYPFVVSAGSAEKVRIAPTDGFNAATGTTTAGEARSFQLEMVDSFGNIVSSENGERTLTWSVGENYPDIPLGGQKITLPSQTTCTVTAGVCAGPFIATFRGASPNFTDGQIKVQAIKSGSNLAGSLAVKVQPAPLGFYSVKKHSAGSPEARRDNTSAAKLSVQVSAHDAFGNNVNVSENKNLKLQIVRTDGSKTFFPNSTIADASRLGNGLIHWQSETNASLLSNTYDSSTGLDAGKTRDQNITYTLLSGQSAKIIDNLAFDDPGSYKIIATDQSNSITSPLMQSETINFTPTLASLKNFYLDLASNLTLVAGQTTTVRVVARTFYNSALRGLDAVLSDAGTYTFSWSTPSNASNFATLGLSGSLPSTGATLPTTFTFIDGSALVPIRFEKVEAIAPMTTNTLVSQSSGTGSKKLGLRGVQAGTGTVHTSTLPETTTVTLIPNALHEYKSEVTGLSGSPTATLDSRFNLTVRALDQYGNPRPGETGLNVVAEKSADSGLPGFNSSTTILRKPDTTDNQFADGFTSFSPNEIDLSNGVWTATGLVYLVPQTVKFTLSGAAVAVNSTNNNSTAGGYISFAPAIGTVKAYTIALNTGTDDLNKTGQYRTHGATSLTVTARDIEGNPVPNLESSLNAQAYVWAGASTLALTSEAPGYPTSPAFNSSGTWATSVDFKATQSFLANTLTIRDNYSVAAGTDFRTGGNASPFTVYSRHKDYTLDAGGANVDWLVNTPSQLKITARGYDNLPVREFDAKLNAFQFDWSGSGFAASPNSTLAVFGDNTTKTGKTFTFSNGVAFVNITPFKKESISGAAVTLTDNSAASAHLLGANKIGVLTGTINVRAGTVTRYVLNAHISNTTTRDRTADDDAATGRFTLDILPTDAYHNPTVGEAGLAISTNGGAKTKTTLKSTVSSFNSASIDLTTGLDATTGKKSFANVYYPVPDTGITFSLSNTAAPVVPTLSMTFDATEKSIVGYNLTVGATQTAGTAFTVTLTPKDIAGNTLTTLSSGLADLQSRRFNLTGPANAPNGNVPLANGTAITGTKDINPSFTDALVGTINVRLLRKETIAAGAFVLEDDFTTPRKAISTNAIAVQSAAPSALHSANLPGVRAGQQIEIKAYLKDTFGNTSFTGCGTGTTNGLYGVAAWKSAGGNFGDAVADVTPSGVFTTTAGKAPEYKTLAASGADVTSSARVSPDATNGDEMKMYVTLYKKGENRISLTACAQTLLLPVDVIEANTAVLARISTSATRPTVATAQTEVECLHSGANSASAEVICPTIYSYFWDTYGNTFADGTGQCSWTGAKANAADPTTLPSIAGSATSLQLTHTGPMNGNLICTGPNATTANLLAFGGISSWQATVIPKTGATAVTVVNTADGNLSGAANKAAVGIPLVVKEIVTRRYKGNSSSLQAYNSTSATSHTMSVDVSNFGGSGVTNIPATMTANLTTAGITSATDAFNFPFTTAHTDKTLILTLRGIPLTIINITVEGGIAETIALDAAGTTAPALPIAGTSYAIKIDVKDSAANLANCTSISVSVVGGGSHASPGNNAAIPGAAQAFTYDSTQTISNDSGFIGRFTVPVTFVKTETISLAFTTLSATCGAIKSFQQTFTVQPKTDTNMHARLSTDGTTPPTQHLEELSCTMGAGLALNCSSIYLHTWDFYGNYIANTTCNETSGWAWASYDNGGNGTSETPSLASGALRSQTLAISSPDVAKGFLDGKLTCARAGTQVHRNGGGTPEEGTGLTPATDIRTIVTGGLKGMTFALEAKNTSGTLDASTSPITTLLAASDNLKIAQITAKKRRINVDVVKNDFVTSATESITLTTAPVTTSSDSTENNRTITSGTSPLMSSTTLECKFTADGICRTPADTAVAAQANMTFAVVESVQRKVVFNLRGKTSEIVVQQVTPAAPASVVFQQGRAATNSSPVAGNAVSETIEVKDAFGNKSTCDKLTVSKQSGTADAPAGETVPGSASTFAYNSAGTVTGSNAGSGSLAHKNFAVSLNFYRAENIAMRFATDTSGANCGTASVQLNHTYNVAAKTDTGMHARLSTNGDTRPTQHLEEIQCPLGAGLAMNCPALYVHVWDAYGNYISNATCDSWTWNHYDAISGATTGTSEVPQAASGAITAGTAFASNTRSQTLTAAGTASGFIDGRLVCNRASTSIARSGTSSIDTANTTPLQTVVYGGIKGIEISADAGPAGALVNYPLSAAITVPTIKAAADNVQLKQLKAFVRKFGAQTSKSDFVAGQNETVVVTTSSTGSIAEQSRTLASGAHPISTNSALTCAFDNVGICKDPATPANSQTMNLNFKVVESAARTVTFSLRGKQATLAVSAVTPANAASLTLAVKNGATETTALNVRQDFSVEAQVKDGFGNATTLKSADGAACAVADASATLNHTTPNATGTALGNATSVSAATWNGGGVYTFNVTNTVVTLAGTKSVTVNACGVSANSTSLSFNPGSLASIVLRNSASITTTVNAASSATTVDSSIEHARCPLQTSGSGVNCPTVYAYFFDQDNNAVSGKSCNWSYANNSASASVYGALLTSPTQSSGNGTTSNTLTHSDFMDGTLTCAEANDNSKTRTIDLYGGVAKVALAWGAKGRNASGDETTTANGTTITAGENNLQLAATTGIKLVGPVRGTNDTLVPDAGTSVPVTFTTSAPNNGGSSPLPTNVSNCDFSTNAGICNNQSYNFNFKTSNAGGTAYQATVSARGKTATLSGITVQPANAANLALTAKMGTNVVTTVTTDDSFDVYAQVKDQYGNFTDLNTSYATCPAPAADGSTTPIDTAGVQANAKAGATSDNSLLPAAGTARVPAKEGGGSVGLYKYSNFNLTGIQANGADANSSLKFQLCSVAQNTSGSTLTLTVKPGKPKNVFVNASTAASRTNMADTLCTLNGTGAGATCAPMYAHFYDANENLITNANGGQCTTWSVANIPTGNPVGLTTPNISTAASNNQTFTSTGAFSLALTCNNTAAGFVPTTVKLRGGIAKIALTWTAKTLDSSNVSVSTASGTTVDAQNENIIIESATFQTYDFSATPTLVSLAQGITNEPLQITTTASAGPTNVNPVPAGADGVTGETTCDMTDGVCTPAAADEIDHSVHKLTLNKASETGRSVTVSARGLSATISGLTVNSGSMVAANRADSIPTTATVDSPLTSGAIELYDMFNNRTQKNCGNLSLAYQYSSNGTSFAAATTGTGSNSSAPDATDPTLPATLTVSSITTGRYELPATAASALKFVKPGTYRLTPTVCGQTLATRDITVSLGAVAKVKLFNSIPGDPYTAIAPTGPIECEHTTASPADDNQPAVACATLNAYFFDSRGNQITDAASAKCNNWTFEKNANSSDSQTLSGLTAATASITPTATDWIDGTLRCEKGGSAGSDLAPQLTIFGGTHSISTTFNTTSPTAGNNNVTLSTLTIHQRKLGSTVVAATARTNEKVGITTTATQAASGSPSAVLSAATYNCNSAASTGACTGTVPNISLTKVETTPSVTLKVRGKTATTTFTVNPGAVSSATLTLGAASPWISGSTSSAQFQPKDTFGNPSQNGCATLTGSNANTSPSSQAPNYGVVGTWTGAHYPITGIALYGASATSQALTYTCGPTTAISASQNIVVNAAATSQVALSTSNSAPVTFADTAITQDLKCTLSSGTNSNTALTCPTVYAWTYDASGNATADNTCQWQKSDWTSSWSAASDIAGAGTTSSLTSATLAATGALNAKLSCAGKTMRNANNIYGGVSRIALVLGQANTQSTSGSTTTYTTTAANFKAAPSNLIITQLNAYSQRESTEVSLPLAAGTTNLTLGATYTGVEDTSPVGTSFSLDTSKLTCSFSAASAQCSTPIEFTFKKVHATPSTRPQISLDLKSKTAIVSVSPITAGNGATLSLTGWPANAPIGANIINGATAQVKDMYGNNSSLSPSGEACSGAAVLTGFQASVFTTGTYANSLTTPATNTGTGLYSITASVYKVANHAVTIAACGLSKAETLVTTAGAFARALITTSATAPANYTCTSDNVCDEVLPTCTAANTASCGPFRVWKYDLGGNPLFTGNASGDCGTDMNGINVTNTVDATSATATITDRTTTSFNITAGTAGKHIAGTIQCTDGGINKGNRVNFKAPTLAKPGFKCYPWGIDNTGNPEALCVVTNETGYVISNVNLVQCENTTATGCADYKNTEDELGNYAISSHCFNLPTKEDVLAQRYAGHRCSVVLTGLEDKKTPPLWVQAASPDTTKVVFSATLPARVPAAYNNSTTFNAIKNHCAASVAYNSSNAAACDGTLAGMQTTAPVNTIALFFDGQGTTSCGDYPNREFKLNVQANKDPAKFLANPVELLDGSTDDYISLPAQPTTAGSCSIATGLNLGANGTCAVTIKMQRPYNETVIKITTDEATPKTYYVRTGESVRCSGKDQDL